MNQEQKLKTLESTLIRVIGIEEVLAERQAILMRKILDIDNSMKQVTGDIKKILQGLEIEGDYKPPKDKPNYIG